MLLSLKPIEDKLSKINQYWNEYYFEKDFFQKRINFTNDVRTNYYGDLNNYISDTLPLIKPLIDTNNTQEYISYYTMLLQTIFVHQDLMDELLYIFKLNKSNSEDKRPNRCIRNELIGHPVSKDKSNKLKSSILFDIQNFDKETIKYHKYSKENKFSSKHKSFSIDDIINRHIEFMKKYLDFIIKKCEKQIKEYDKKIKTIFKIPLKKQFDFIEQNDSELLSRTNIVFEKDYLEYSYEKIKQHKRYLYHLRDYKEALLNVVYKRNVSISYKKHMLPKYMIEQLNKKNSVFNIDFYIKQYKDNHLIYDELLNMKKHINNKEYYISLNYLQSL